MKLKEIKTPLVFFKHEPSNWHPETLRANKIYALTDDAGHYVPNSSLYIVPKNADLSGNICIMHKMIEKEYDDSILSWSKKYGEVSSPYYYDTVDVAINLSTCEEIYQADKFMHTLTVYGNLIVESHDSFRDKIINMNGEVLWEGWTDYCSLFNTKEYLIIKTKHDYNTDIDTVCIFNKLLGTKSFNF